ncbi:hypothetical protein [Kaistia nematophila]|uniref:Uncharacterized protein n=1 Tax=Kaistia nematophila TaxID=2994654 RepID=A0A9X3DXP7_9HYPH|nr:hypothetical protein [Kaistia nematophila]MCX5567836.1 hypothetical protein [Kaistia nematophila]
MLTGQAILRAWILIAFVAHFGIVLGLLSEAFSIAFDGVYALAGAGVISQALSLC